MPLYLPLLLAGLLVRRTPPPRCGQPLACASEPVSQGRTQAAVDVSSANSTYSNLCRMCGVSTQQDAEMDVDGFVLAFEQLFCNGAALAPELADELCAAVSAADGEDVSRAGWAAFHARWQEASSAAAHLAAMTASRREATALAEKEARLAEAAERERAWVEKQEEYILALAEAKKAAKEAAAKAAESARPKLMADLARRPGNWFEQREGAAQVAAAYRSLDPEAWEEVTRSVGGLGETLETIRRRIWVPLCAPRYLLDELGAERVKGLLLYGPPGCGKSYLASRRTAASRPHLGDISTTPR